MSRVQYVTIIYCVNPGTRVFIKKIVTHLFIYTLTKHVVLYLNTGGTHSLLQTVLLLPLGIL
jgi:hypothetical protein